MQTCPVPLQQDLPIDYINPPAVFEADLPKCSHPLKA